ncbi:MAG TPA: serine hydrolase domain-containing protein [Thermomicrobiales bacterium]|nr:serine hydrolase domain-containing protein [Thermomicrobiales bacterium]
MSTTPTIRWPQDRPAYTSLKAAVQGEAARWNVPGISAGILRDGDVEVQVTGATSIETGFPVTEKTLFQIGSISKIFTATLIMRFRDRGLLDLDIPVIEYVPELPLENEDARATITLRHLLSHTAGFEGDRFTDYGRGDEALGKAVADLGASKQWFAPGTLFSYNNAAFYLAGYIIEKITGKVFEKVMEEEIFTPLKLERTVLLPEWAMTYAHAVGHDVDRAKGPQIVRPFTLSRHVAAAGAIISCASDMLRFAQMHINDGELDGERIISAAAAQEMRQFIIPTDASGTTFGHSYGVGWARWEFENNPVVGHGGSISGFRAQLWLAPEKKWAFVVLTNGSTGARAMSELRNWAFTRELGIVFPDPEVADLSDEELSRHTGTYTRHDGTLDIAVHGKGLRITQSHINEDTGEPEGDPAILDLEPVSADSYRITTPEAYGGIVDFFPHPAPDGTPQHLVRVGGRLAAKKD